MDRRTLLDHAARDAEERVLLAHILDQYERCAQRGVPTHTDFLSESEQQSARALLAAAGARDGFSFRGGYPDAERRILCFLPAWQETADEASFLAAVRVHYRAADAPGHRALLGSALALGLKRAKLGDILISAESADVLAGPETAAFLAAEWKTAGRAALRTEIIAPDALRVPERRVRVIQDTVASPRLDAVLSSGFALSRAKAAALIAAGRVSVNGRETLKGDARVAPGDVISARGLGKCALAEAGGVSRKGRTRIVLHRYL